MFVPSRTASTLDFPETKPLPELPTKQMALSESHKPRSLSLSDRFKNILPKHRPERGGTVREHGFWEQRDSKGRDDYPPIQHRATDSRQSRRSDTADSDRIIRWNTAKELSKQTPARKPLPTRTVSASIDSLTGSGPNRRWSWSPQEQHFPTTFPRREVANEDRDEEAVNHPSVKDTSELRAALFASRRLSHARRVIEAKRESRRNRRSLKESGDYLGVQGINPETGELDIVTPSDSEQSAGGLEMEQKVAALKKIIQNSPPSHAATKARAQREIKRTLVKEHDKLQRLEREKDALKRANSNVRWRRQTKQWSSAQEPNLSPIAQSHKNMTSSSSQQTPLDEQAPRKGRLIDLSTSRGLQRVLQATTAHGNTSTERSGSSGTVVRTPHRQSTADPSTAAQELFENGISFDDIAQSVDSNERGLLNNAPESLFQAASNSGSCLEEARSPRQVLPDQHPTFQATSTQHISALREPKKGQTDNSFLDLRTRKDIDPGGSRQKATNNPHPRSAELQSPTISQQLLNLLPSKTRLSQTLLEHKHKSSRVQTEELLKGFTQDLTTPPKRLPPTTMSPKSSSRLSLERKRLAECDLSFLLVNERNGKGESPSVMCNQEEGPTSPRQDGTEDTACRERSQALTHGTPVKSPKLDQREFPLTKDEIRGDLKALKSKLAQIDLPNLTTLPRGKHPKEANQTWAQDAIRDITNRGNEVMEVSACTTITTTTGSGPGMSPLGQSQGPRNVLDRPRKRQLGRLTWNLPKRRVSTDSLESLSSSPTRLTPNASPSPAPTAETPAVGITSVRHLEPTKQRTQTLVSKPSHEVKGNLTIDGSQCIRTSPMFTSMIHQDDRKILAKVKIQQELPVMAVKIQVEKENLQAQPKAPSSEPKINMMERTSSGRGRRQGSSPQPAERRRVCAATTKAARDRSVHIPGTYPTHPDAEDDIANLSNVFHLDKTTRILKIQPAYLWKITKAVSRALHVNILWLLKLYWATIRPVFKSESEYWVRKARQQNTWGDSVVITLAFPVAFLVVVGLL